MSTKPDLNSILAELQEQARPQRSNLRGLSNLDETGLARLREVWAGLPPERRLWVVLSMWELAEDNFELDFAPIFEFALGDPDADVRQAAIEGLWETEDVKVADLLLAMLRDDLAETVRAAAAAALGQYTYLAEMQEVPQEVAGRVRAGLLATIRSDEPPAVRRRAVEAIGFLSGDDEIRQVIAEAYAEADPSMRTSAVFAMGRSCDPQWLRDLLHELESPNPEMRFEAARACGEVEDRRAVPRLLRLLVDPDAEVRLAAIQSLGAIGGDQALAALRQLTESEDEAVAEAAEDALVEAEFAESPAPFGLEDLHRHDHPHDHDHKH